MIADYTLHVQQEAVVSLDTREIVDIRDRFVGELKETGAFSPWRILIYGYREDHRELYEIPEVKNWCKVALDHVPFLPLILAGETAKWFMLSLAEAEQRGSSRRCAPLPRTPWVNAL